MAEITWKSILTKLVGGDHLTAEESEWFVDDLMQGNANPAAVGAIVGYTVLLCFSLFKTSSVTKSVLGAH